MCAICLFDSTKGPRPPLSLPRPARKETNVPSSTLERLRAYCSNIFTSSRTRHGLRIENKCDDRAQLACQTIRPTYQVCIIRTLHCY